MLSCGTWGFYRQNSGGSQGELRVSGRLKVNLGVVECYGAGGDWVQCREDLECQFKFGHLCMAGRWPLRVGQRCALLGAEPLWRALLGAETLHAVG